MGLVLKIKRKIFPLHKNGCVNQRSCYRNSFTTVFYNGVDWVIAGIAKSTDSDALHPASVRSDEWLPRFVSISFSGATSQNKPVSLEHDLGVDFFFRSDVRLTKPIWYVSPSGKLTHSAAKRHGDVLGTRWCHLCHADVSSNNFVSQHMKRVHHPTRANEWHLFCRFISTKIPPSVDVIHVHRESLCTAAIDETTPTSSMVCTMEDK